MKNKTKQSNKTKEEKSKESVELSYEPITISYIKKRLKILYFSSFSFFLLHFHSIISLNNKQTIKEQWEAVVREEDKILPLCRFKSSTERLHIWAIAACINFSVSYNSLCSFVLYFKHYSNQRNNKSMSQLNSIQYSITRMTYNDIICCSDGHFSFLVVIFQNYTNLIHNQSKNNQKTIKQKQKHTFWAFSSTNKGTSWRATSSWES